MQAENIRRVLKESKLFKIILIFLLAIILGLYFRVFFTKGIQYDDTFLKKDVIGADSHFIGRNQWGGIHITVKGIKGAHDNIEVIYRLPNNIVKLFTVNFKKDEDFREKVVIKDNNSDIIFEGRYREGDVFLFDKNGEPVFEGIGRIIVNNQNPYKSDYEIYLINVVKLASGEYEEIRGKVELLIMALFLIAIIAIDIKFPLFFFQLKHFLSVKDPEPSEFYIAMQRATWYVIPAIAVIILLAAIF